MIDQTVRSSCAETAYLSFEFGDDVTVNAANGWEYSQPGTEMTRKVFVNFKGDPLADSSVLIFTVLFADESSAVVSEVYALNATSGNMVGSPQKPRSTRGKYVVPVQLELVL